MIEAFKEEVNKSFTEVKKNTTKRVKKINRTENGNRINKTETEGILEMENLAKRTGTTDTSITNSIQEIKERISGLEDKIKE